MISLSAKTIDLTEVGDTKALLTREQGANLRLQIVKLLDTEPMVVLDLSNVEALSPSFADELFATLDAVLEGQFPTRVKIICPSNDWKQLIRTVLAHRRSHPRAISQP